MQRDVPPMENSHESRAPRLLSCEHARLCAMNYREFLSIAIQKWESESEPTTMTACLSMLYKITSTGSPLKKHHDVSDTVGNRLDLIALERKH